MINCPVCGESVENYDICENCNWQNSGENENENGPCGPNNITLKEAKDAYIKSISN